MYNIDSTRTETTEKYDYDTAVTVFQNIISPIKYKTTFTQMPMGWPTDMRFKIENLGKKYVVEIKQRNQDMTKYPQLQLKQWKLRRMYNDTKDDETLLYIVLVNDSEFFIYNMNELDFSEVEWQPYDLDKIDFSSIVLTDWEIKNVQYSVDEKGSETKPTPTYFLPISMACAHGKIPK